MIMEQGGGMELQPMLPGDWPAVRAIYDAGIATGNATFDTAAPHWSAWDAAHLAGHRLVARLDGRVVGWAALAPVSDRCAYAGVAEDSIYVAPQAQRRGVGRAPADRGGRLGRAGRDLDRADRHLPREPAQRPPA
jgi:L-amino acid N-acyltransferase YncA